MQHPSAVSSLLWSRAVVSLYAGGGDSVNPAPEGEGPPTREEEEVEKMQANPAYLPIEMSRKMPEKEYTDKAGPEGEGPPTKGETEGGRMQADSEHEATYESMDNDPIDEYEMASLGSRAELRGGELCSTPQLSQSLL